MNTNIQKKIAVINDLSGYGRCSLTVSLPIVSAMGIQCCPIPTAILSNQTEYPNYFFKDCTEYLEEYIDNWEKLNLVFDGIATGFLGSREQINIVKDFIERFSCSNVLVDPVMGDNGKIYDTYTEEMCLAMKDLVSVATIVTPNLTEACILTDIPYSTEMDEDILLEIASKISDMGPQYTIITGIIEEEQLCNYIYCEDGNYTYYKTPIIKPNRPGTGDVFASVVIGDIINGHSPYEAVSKASDFISMCLESSSNFNIPINDGVCFEKHLREL